MGELRVTYALHLQLIGKRVVDLIFAIMELFSLALMVETLQADSDRSPRFSKEGVSLCPQI